MELITRVNFGLVAVPPNVAA